MLPDSGRNIQIDQIKLTEDISQTTTFWRWAVGAEGRLTTTFSFKSKKSFFGQGGLTRTITLDYIETKIKWNEKNIPERHLKKIEKIIKNNLEKWIEEVKDYRELEKKEGE